MEITLTDLTRELTGPFVLSVAAFLLAMMLTPVYTFLAYRYKFWKKQRKTSTTGGGFVGFYQTTCQQI